jgi:predicted DNA-binding protein
MAKMGRPTDAPKINDYRVRLSDKDLAKLEYCCTVTGKTKADVIREGIKKFYKGLMRKK